MLRPSDIVTMYKTFFGLNRNPFELSPDPSFLCPLGKSEEALASIYHAVERRKGFVVLTGEVGTGKTLTVRYLCELWKDRQIPFANVIGPRLSVTDFLSYVAFDLGIKISESSKGNLLRALYQFLLTQFEKGLTTVLIVDEAHQLPGAVLEEIRLLTNFETAQEKLLQILLVGQPELETKLDSFELRQLKQRIAIRCQLEPFTEDETRRYIERRLTLAGASSQASSIFPLETVRGIYRYSTGVPRLVNSICEQALVAAYARQIHVVPAEMVDEVAEYFRLRPVLDLRRMKHAVASLETAKNIVPRPQWQPADSPRAAEMNDAELVDVSNLQQRETEPDETPAILNSHDSNEPRELEDQQRVLKSLHFDPVPETAELEATRTSSFNAATDQAIRPDAQRSAQGAASGGSVKNREEQSTGAKDVNRVSVATKGPAADAVKASDVGIAAHKAEVLRFWRSRGVIPVWLILFFVLVCGAVYLIRLAAIARAASSSTVPLVKSMAGQIASETQLNLVSREVEQDSGLGPSAREEAPPAGSPRLHEKSKISSRPRHVSVASLESASMNEAPPMAETSRAVGGQIAPPDPSQEAEFNEKAQVPIVAVAGPRAPEPTERVSEPVRQPGGRFQPARLISTSPVVYPQVAKRANIQGDVVVNAVIDEQGHVAGMQVVSGPLVLRQAAVDALRQWRYEPGLLNGQPVPVQVVARIRFQQ